MIPAEVAVMGRFLCTVGLIFFMLKLLEEGVKHLTGHYKTVDGAKQEMINAGLPVEHLTRAQVEQLLTGAGRVAEVLQVHVLEVLEAVSTLTGGTHERETVASEAGEESSEEKTVPEDEKDVPE